MIKLLLLLFPVLLLFESWAVSCKAQTGLACSELTGPGRPDSGPRQFLRRGCSRRIALHLWICAAGIALWPGVMGWTNPQSTSLKAPIGASWELLSPVRQRLLCICKPQAFRSRRFRFCVDFRRDGGVRRGRVGSVDWILGL